MRNQNINLIAILSILVFTVSACLNFSKENIRGNGELISNSQELSPFQSLSVYGSFQTTYVVDPQYKITIVAESNLMEYILVEVDQGVLTVKVNEEVSIRPKEDINLLIQGPALSSVAQTGSGDMIIGTFSNDAAIDISVTGSGSISGQVNVPNVGIDVTGSGTVQISGRVIGLKAEITGTGTIDASELISAGAEAYLQGSGAIYSGASERLKATVLGSGNVYYTGEPELESSVNGSGKIEQKN